MSGMRRYVSALMVSMNSNVQSHQLPKILVFKSKLVGVVSAVIESTISGWRFSSLFSIAVVIDESSNS